MSGDWRKGVDPKTGMTYFYNRKTKTSQWTKPPEMEDGGLDPLNNPAKWKEAIDPASGLPYWYNKAAGKKSTFIKPACLINNSNHSTVTVSSPSENHQIVSPLPPPITNSSSRSHSPSLSLSDDSVRNSWRTAKDPATGHFYWINKATGQATWDDPLKPAVSPVPKVTLAQVLKREIDRSHGSPSTEDDAPPPPPEEETTQHQSDSQADTILKLQAELSEKAAFLDKQQKTFAMRQAEWDLERAALLKRQKELQMEVANLTTKMRSEPMTVDRLQREMMEKFALLENQNQQVLSLLQHQSITSLRPLTPGRSPRSH